MRLKIIYPLFSLLALVACSESEVAKPEPTKTDRDRLGLKGDVKSMESDREKFVFNEFGNYTSEIVWSPDGALATNTRYTYTPAGLVAKRIGLNNSRVENFSYREDGQLLEELSLWRGGKYNYKLSYIYNELGLLTSQVRINADGSESVQLRNNYNEKKQLRDKEIYSGGKSAIYAYEYDEVGNVIRALEHIDFQYEYDSRGNKIVERGYNLNGSFRFKYTFKFNDSDQLVERAEYNGGDEIISVYEYKYDVAENDVEQNYFAPPGHLGFKYVRTYDNNSNLMRSSYFEGNFKSPQSFESYVYDSKNNWVEKKNAQGAVEKRVLTYFHEEVKRELPPGSIDAGNPKNIIDCYVLLSGNHGLTEIISVKSAGETFTNSSGGETTLINKNVAGGYFEVGNSSGIEKRQTQYVQWNLPGGDVLLGVNEILYLTETLPITESVAFYKISKGEWKSTDVGILTAISSEAERTRFFETQLGKNNHELFYLLQLPEKGKDISLKIIDLEEALLNDKTFAKKVILKWEEGSFKQ